MKNSIPILSLKPTQFAVGMLEVDEKILELKKLSRKKLKALVKSTPIPVVISPHEEYYVVDHHHFLCVCYHLDIKDVQYEVVANHAKSKMTFSQFWRWMLNKKRMYPFCQFGEGPRKALYLPRDIRGLADDPYRSLAWYVRKAGAFDNSTRNFAEFQWANFFRKRGLLDRHGTREFAAALKKAVALAQTPAAKDLPGFGKLNLDHQKAVLEKAHKAGKKTQKRALAPMQND
jgi:hypothetical protein